MKNADLTGESSWISNANTLTQYSTEAVETVVTTANINNLNIIGADRLLVGTAGESRLIIEPPPSSNYITKIYPQDVLNFVILNDSSGNFSYTIAINLVEPT